MSDKVSLSILNHSKNPSINLISSEPGTLWKSDWKDGKCGQWEGLLGIWIVLRPRSDRSPRDQGKTLLLPVNLRFRPSTPRVRSPTETKVLTSHEVPSCEDRDIDTWRERGLCVCHVCMCAHNYGCIGNLSIVIICWLKCDHSNKVKNFHLETKGDTLKVKHWKMKEIKFTK